MLPVQTFLCADRQCKAFIELPKREAAYPPVKLLELGIFPMRCLACGKLQAPYAPGIETPVPKEAAQQREPSAPCHRPTPVEQYLERVKRLVAGRR